MKASDILLEEMKAAGIEGGEVLAQKFIGALENTFTKVAVHPETSQTEKTVAVVLAPVFAGFKPALNQLIDFNKDGKIG